MRHNFHIAIGLLWVTPVLSFLQYSMVWDRLPLRLATLFGANGQVNGWMSRETSAVFPVLVLLPILLLATLVLMRIRKPDAGSWATLGVFYVVACVLLYANHQILAFNLHDVPVRVLPIAGGVFATTLLFLLIFLGTKRGGALPPADVVAEEVHGSRAWAMMFLLLLGLFGFLALRIPDSIGRTVFAFTGLIFVPLATATWSGFHYRFTQAGVEIRALGFRLRSIPKEHIREYRPASWPWIGGYGIRGLGEDRAYVWSNSGVRISTTAGSVFLGHDEPQRLVRDLDALTGAAHSC